MARKTTQWFLSLQITLYLVLIFVRGNEDTEDAYKNGRNLVLEYFLPINEAVDAPMRREKRDVEGSGDEDSVFSELKEKTLEEADNSTRNAFAKSVLQGENGKPLGGSSVEGSGEVDDVSESSIQGVPIIADSEVFTTTESDRVTKTAKPEVITEINFHGSEDYDEVSTTETEQITTIATEPTPAVISTTDKESETTTLSEENTTKLAESRQSESTTFTIQETTTHTKETTSIVEEATTVVIQDIQTNTEGRTELPATTTTEETSTLPIPIMISEKNISEVLTTQPVEKNISEAAILTSTVSSIPEIVIPNATQGLPAPANLPTTPEPVIEEIFKETKIEKKLEALPGNILQKENLSLAADTLLIANTRLMDSEENVQLSSSEPKRLGAYIVIGLILLSFSSLVGYITFKKRMNRKRQEFESNQESNDTEKALLSLSDYKDNSELEENHLKNNEITPIVVKSNTQINKFEKNTNFSSPKNLNTIANEKNIEKDNVLKSTAENLTQVIIEDSPKDLEEDKNVPSMEKLIVKTRIDQDSIPKKPIIVNRSSTGYLPIPQDNS